MFIVVDVVVECELSPKDLLSVNCLSDVKYFLLTSDFILLVFVNGGFLANKCANAFFELRVPRADACSQDTVSHRNRKLI